MEEFLVQTMKVHIISDLNYADLSRVLPAITLCHRRRVCWEISLMRADIEKNILQRSPKGSCPRFATMCYVLVALTLELCCVDGEVVSSRSAESDR